MSLTDYTTMELLEEIAKRVQPEIKEWCDDCGHFSPDPAADPNYNPCDLKHKMDFAKPKSMDDEFGFYRLICTDRV